MNRLGSEPSPYLRQHRDNPVDWYPWGEEALTLARTQGRPILLSVGYSACHWCHVMAHESFEDPAVAELMNRSFVNIKVDREERPDLDQLYQGVVQLMGRGGGWPLTVFLTPDLRPFYGGTYFPPAARHGLPAFPALLESLARAFSEQRADVESQAQAFKEGLTEYAALGLDAAPAAFSGEDVVAAARTMGLRLDPVHGGFGNTGPKFPNPMNLAAMLRGHRRSGVAALRDGVLFTLERMARGGLHDQLGGGFHRYAVDERWRTPHFEKMLYDNAQLLHLYAEAHQVEARPLFRSVAEDLVGWLEREMTSPQGAFHAAQDADSEGEEGKFFVWRPEEVKAALPDGLDAALLLAHLGVKPGGNFEHGASVLEVVEDAPSLALRFNLPLEEVSRRLQGARAQLLEVRSRRVPPGRDDKVLAGWNGLMIRGLAHASRAFARPDWARLAGRAADFLLASLRAPDGGLWRSFQDGQPRGTGMLEDLGDVAAGLTALYQATFEPRYLAAAEQLADLAHERFWDAGREAYLAAPRGQADLLVPTYALHDNAFPSGASSLAEAQVALGALTGRPRHLDRARAYVERLRGPMLENPFAFGHLLLAADSLADGAAEVTLVGESAALAPFEAFLAGRYLPTLAVSRQLTGQPVPAVLAELLQGRPAGATPRAFLCRSFACLAPVETVPALAVLLEA
jgi:uncharacterized protein YyaL (SSP411 family)